MLHYINVNKVYKKENGDDFYALKNFTFNFDRKGLYTILGKSGSGKSTIANLGALIDTPSSGEIFYSGQDITKFKEKAVNWYRSKIVTLIFQHYNLLGDLSVLENIIVPRLAIQEDEKVAKKDALELLKSLGFSDEFAQKPCKSLSGGECQRVAILRSIINNPEIIIADEPTGALDETNSIAIMELLKKLSAKKIVIVITHNIKLAKAYSDEILYLQDGELTKHELKRKRTLGPQVKLRPESKIGKHSKWLYRFAYKRLKNNKSKNILSGCSIVFGLISVFLIIGFSNGSKSVVDKKCLERFDYGVGEISKKETINLKDSMLDLTKLTRLDDREIKFIKKDFPFLKIETNFDELFTNKIVKFNGKEINNVTLEFIYDFDDTFCDKKLIYKGNLAKYNGVMINSIFEKQLLDRFKIPSLIGRDINLSARYELNLGNTETRTSDEFYFNQTFKVYGCSKEFTFLGVPKIYISYKYIKNYLLMEIMPHYSDLMKQEITWLDYIKHASNTDEITSFSHKVFTPAENIRNLVLVQKAMEDKQYTLDYPQLMVKDTFLSLIDGVKVGLMVFSILTIIGTILIIGINGFSSFTFERKNNAIFFAYGVSKNQIFTIFILESMLVTCVAFMLSVIFSFGLQYLLNFFILKKFDIPNMIQIPFKSMLGIPMFLIIITFIFSLAASMLFTYLPLAFSKKISLKKELSDE